MSTIINPIVRQAAEWQNQLNDKELLEQAVGTHQYVALTADDLKELLACGSTVIMGEGTGSTCRAALDHALQSVQSTWQDGEVKATLTSVIIQNKEIFQKTGIIDAMETINKFFENFSSDTNMVWGISMNPDQSSAFVIKQWFVTT